jgi:hypothetical protein
VWVAADSTIKFSFHGIGSDHPKSSDLFLLDVMKWKGILFLFGTFKVELLEN